MARGEDGALDRSLRRGRHVASGVPPPRLAGIRRGSIARAAGRALRGAVRLRRRAGNRSDDARARRRAANWRCFPRARLAGARARADGIASVADVSVLRDCGALGAGAAGSRCALRHSPAGRASPRTRHRGARRARTRLRGRRNLALAARYAVLAHDLGKAETAPAAWPAHHGHEARSVRLASRMSARLRVPVDCRDAARLAARWHGTIHRAAELRPSTLLDLMTAVDALRRPDRLDTLLAACEADACRDPG